MDTPPLTTPLQNLLRLNTVLFVLMLAKFFLPSFPYNILGVVLVVYSIIVLLFEWNGDISLLGGIALLFFNAFMKMTRPQWDFYSTLPYTLWLTTLGITLTTRAKHDQIQEYIQQLSLIKNEVRQYTHSVFGWLRQLTIVCRARIANICSGFFQIIQRTWKRARLMDTKKIFTKAIRASIHAAIVLCKTIASLPRAAFSQSCIILQRSEKVTMEMFINVVRVIFITIPRVFLMTVARSLKDVIHHISILARFLKKITYYCVRHSIQCLISTLLFFRQCCRTIYLLTLGRLSFILRVKIIALSIIAILLFVATRWSPATILIIIFFLFGLLFRWHGRAAMVCGWSALLFAAVFMFIHNNALSEYLAVIAYDFIVIGILHTMFYPRWHIRAIIE